MSNGEHDATSGDLLVQLYQENAKIAAVFWDWRHKVMTFTFTLVSALTAAGGWASGHHVSKYAIAGAFFIAALLTASTGALNWRIGKIVDKTYAAGAALEDAMKRQLGASLGGHDLMFSLMLRDKDSEKEIKTWVAKVVSRLSKPTFGWVLSGSYYALAIAFVVVAILVMV